MATNADAVHPGYGFLAESASFAKRVTDHGVEFVGPAAHWLEEMGHKVRARERAAALGIPVTRGSALLDADPLTRRRAAEHVGFPLVVKPAAGGGGIGMIRVDVSTGSRRPSQGPRRLPSERLEWGGVSGAGSYTSAPH